MISDKNSGCRLPQRADTVAGVELVAGLCPIAAVPDQAREEAIKNVCRDETTAKRILRRSPVLPAH